MKRSYRRLIHLFTQWVEKMSWQEKVGYTLGVLLGIIIGIIVFVSMDKVPATPMDYQPLEQKAISVQQNQKLLLETNCDININDEVITITFKNDKCKVCAEYNKNFEMLSYTKEDNHIFWGCAILLALIFGSFAYLIGAMVLTVIVLLISEIVAKCKIKIQVK